METILEWQRTTNVAAADRAVRGGVSVQTLSDEELLRLCAKGREEALQELTRRYQKPLYRFLTRFLGSTDDAEQAVLNVFVRAWQYAPRFQYRSQVSTWLYRIATNIAHDLHKRKRARPQEEPWPETQEMSVGPVANAEEQALALLARREQAQTLSRALDRMREDDRLLLVLYYFEERSYEEIQEIANLTKTVLKMRLTRARQRLRALLESEEGKTTP